MNRRLLAASALVCLLPLAACGDDEPTDGTGDAGQTLTPLEQLHADVIMPTCGGLACHLDGQTQGSLNLDLSDGLMDRLLGDSTVEGVPMVTPGDPNQSYLYLKLSDAYEDVGGDGSPMPLGTTGLGDDDLTRVEDWILSLGE